VSVGDLAGDEFDALAESIPGGVAAALARELVRAVRGVFASTYPASIASLTQEMIVRDDLRPINLAISSCLSPPVSLAACKERRTALVRSSRPIGSAA
jgi:hypothetical protein